MPESVRIGRLQQDNKWLRDTNEILQSEKAGFRIQRDNALEQRDEAREWVKKLGACIEYLRRARDIGVWGFNDGYVSLVGRKVRERLKEDEYRKGYETGMKCSPMLNEKTVEGWGK